MLGLPRQLTVDELAELFSGRTRFVELLAEEEDPLTRADGLIEELSYEDKVEALAAHPRIGENPQEIVIPIYPKELAGKNISAECYVHIDIDEDGKITDCSIDDPKLPKPFADSVLSAVKQWRFVPQQFLEKSSGKITTSAAGYTRLTRTGISAGLRTSTTG